MQLEFHTNSQSDDTNTVEFSVKAATNNVQWTVTANIRKVLSKVHV